MRRVLVVDDHAEARALLCQELADAGHHVCQAGDGIDGWQQFCEASPDLVITDLQMPRADGFELLRRIRDVSRVPVIMLTAHGDVRTAVRAMKAGAQEFLSLPDDMDRMLECANTWLRAGPEADAQVLRAEDLADRLVGSSAPMQRVRRRVFSLAHLDVPVLVAGERGSGRDHVVRVLHALGSGAGTRLAVVRAGELVAGELGASPSDIYLDELGLFDAAAQRHWLAWLRRREAGDARGRLFASTCDDLAESSRRGALLPELAQRLGRFVIPLPPLRERGTDLPELVEGLVRPLGTRLGRPRVRVAPAAQAALTARAWPGNVAELAAVLEQLIAFSPDGVITAEAVSELGEDDVPGLAPARMQREQREREALRRALEQCQGNLAAAARQLGIARGTLIYRAQKFGLLPPRRRGLDP